MMRRTILTSLPFLAAVICTYACSSTDNTVTTPDAGTVTVTGDDSGTPVVTADAATSDGGGASFGFTPSNITISGVDFTKLTDMDIDANCVFQYSPTGGITDCGDDNAQYVYQTQSDGTGVGVYFVKSFKIEPNANVTISGNRPIVIVSMSTMEIQGTINASAGSLPESSSPGGFGDTGTYGMPGGGPGGGGAATSSTAGGGGSNCGIGGTGASVTGTATAAGGPMAGTPTIIPLTGGSSGGEGEGAGTGGGAIQLVAATSITFASTGFVSAGGGGGNASGDGTQMAGGGGSGGNILIESPVISIAGSLAVNGGGGGGGGNGTIGSGDGSGAALTLAASAGGGANGGASNSGSSINGVAGAAPAATYDPGAGGGGAGRIRLNSTSGAATITGTFSPAVGTTCVTQGMLTQ